MLWSPNVLSVQKYSFSKYTGATREKSSYPNPMRLMMTWSDAACIAAPSLNRENVGELTTHDVVK